MSHGLLVAFETPEELLAGARILAAEGYTALDAHSPYALHELPEALGWQPTRLPWLVFAAGLVGGLSGFLFQCWTSLSALPLNVGGRPELAWPSFLPITFEMMVLSAALMAFVSMLALNGLPRLHHPVFAIPEFARASQDRFFLCVEARDPRFDLTSTRARLAELAGARGVYAA